MNGQTGAEGHQDPEGDDVIAMGPFEGGTWTRIPPYITDALEELDVALGEALKEGEKDTNPKDAVGVKKVPFSVIPAEVIARLGIAMMEGARKYGRHNYRIAGVRASVYYDAILRHATAWWEGQDLDPESGEHHLVKLMASITVLLDSIFNNNWTDDRPPKLPDGWQNELNAKAAALTEKYPNPKAAYTEKP